MTALAAAGTELRGDPTDHPVAQILCGPFLGSGSRAMVVSFLLGICYGTSGWAVFRLADGGWTLVQRSRAEGLGVRLTAEGSDIRETEPIPAADMSCVGMTGQTHTRLWHWNGTKLDAGPWEEKAPPTTTKAAAFVSPSGNLQCEMTDDGTDGVVACRSAVPRNAVQMEPGGHLTICRGNRQAGSCFSGDDTVHTVLAYGQRITVGRFRCDSEETGVTCIVTDSGKGFTINHTGVTEVGTTGTRGSSDYSMFHSPSGNIVCELQETSAYCEERRMKNATMDPDGRLVIRDERFGDLGDNYPGDLLDYGSRVTVGPFRCSSEPTGVTCVVVATGKGFHIDRSGVTPV